MDMKRVGELARRQLLIVLLAFVTCASLAYWTESRKPKIYVASANILQLSAGSTDGGTFSAAAGDIDRFSQIQAALSKARPCVSGC